MNVLERTWKDFELECQSKKVILYGLGSLLNCLFIRVNKNISIIAAVDNEKSKQNHLLKDFFDEADLQEAKNIVISPKKILRSYNPNEVVILISSLRHSESIAQDLESMGFYNYFSVLHLEFNYKEYRKRNNLPIETQDNYIESYANICIEKFPIQNNKIIFGGMDRYPDHGRYITEKLLLMNKDLDIVWLTNTPSIEAPKGVRIIYEGKWKSLIYELETAKIWIFDMPIRTQAIKRMGQTYIQVKHWGSITLKKFYLNEEVNDFEREVWKRNGEMIDYIISGSEFDEETCKRGFNFNKIFLRFGSPRSDILFKPNFYKEKVFKRYSITSDKKILIYAPTFRTVSLKKDYNYQELDFELITKSLNQKFKGDWIIFLRYHPSVKMVSDLDEHFNNIINVSDYESAQELVAASDIMISDYSSIMFEPAYVMKPVFLYAPDREEYIKNERDFLIDYDSLPFPKASTNKELAIQITNFNEIEYQQAVKKFLDNYSVNEDGHASERTAKFILKLLN